MYNYIVFDIDGTLTDTQQPLLISLQNMLSERGIEKTLDELKFSFGIPGADTMRHLEVSDAEAALVRWNELLRARKEKIKLFDRTLETLDALKAAGKKLGIITSKTRDEYELDFIPMGLAHYFDFYACADDTGKHKPDPEPMRYYLASTGAQAQETLYIGDAVYDWKCAQGAGVDFALATWGCISPDQIRPNYAPETMDALLKIIL